MKNKLSFLNILPVALGLILSAGTATLFRACGMKEDGTWMKCHTVQEAVIIAGLIAALWFLTAALIRHHVVRVLFYPMCMLQTMRCYTIMQPFVRIMAAAAAIASAVIAMNEVKAQRR